MQLSARRDVKMPAGDANLLITSHPAKSVSFLKQTDQLDTFGIIKKGHGTTLSASVLVSYIQCEKMP